MQEFNLKSIWDEGKPQADNYYKEIRQEVLDMAQAKSAGVLQKIKREAQLNFVLSLAIFPVFVYLLWDALPIVWYLMLIVSVATSGIAYYYYRQFLQRIEGLSQDNIITYIEQFIEIFQVHRNRNWNITNILGLFGGIIGFIGGFNIGDQDLSHFFTADMIPISMLVLLVFFAIAYQVSSMIFKWFYDKKIETLQQLLEDIKAT